MTDTRLRTGHRRPGRAARLVALPLGALLLLGLQGCQDPTGNGGDNTPSDTPGSSAPASGGPGRTTPPATAADTPCSLVTRQEAERLAGSPLRSGKAVSDTCTYTAPASGATAQVEVFAGESGKAYYDAERQLGHELKALDGIGDEAYLEDGSVFLRVAREWVSVRLVNGEEAAHDDEPLEDLARTVATRL